MYIKKLINKQLINPPSWLPENTMFEGLTGSVAYGVSNDTSDMDVIGFAVPPKHYVFPKEIMGFGTPGPRFEQYQQHHVYDTETRKKFDLTIYSIVKFFQLTMENNPNMIDALFLPRRCVLHSTELYERVREKRHLFLHAGSWHTFKGYAYSQLAKIKNKTNASNEKRNDSINKYGYDTKFGYHLVRLLNEVEQILVEGDLDLERNREQLKAIRNGDWSLEELEKYFFSKELDLEKAYSNTKLPYKPREEEIRELLVNCLEMHYGNLDLVPKTENKLLFELKELIHKYET